MNAKNIEEMLKAAKVPSRFIRRDVSINDMQDICPEVAEWVKAGGMKELPLPHIHIQDEGRGFDLMCLLVRAFVLTGISARIFYIPDIDLELTATGFWRREEYKVYAIAGFCHDYHAKPARSMAIEWSLRKLIADGASLIMLSEVPLRTAVPWYSKPFINQFTTLNTREVTA